VRTAPTSSENVRARTPLKPQNKKIFLEKPRKNRTFHTSAAPTWSSARTAPRFSRDLFFENQITNRRKGRPSDWGQKRRQKGGAMGRNGRRKGAKKAAQWGQKGGALEALFRGQTRTYTR
jgi:hypothetical protein